MNKFCEECGNKLTPGDKFCDQCGTPLPQEQTNDQPQQVNAQENDKPNSLAFDFFSEKRVSAKADDGIYYGILLVNFKKVSEKFGIHESQKLKEVIASYIAWYSKIGLQYLVLDTSNNVIRNVGEKSWKYHVDIVRKAVKRIKDKLKVDTRFLMIFGGHEFIPMPLLPNPNTSTSDKDVDTDLPYSTLSVKDPMESEDARKPTLPVGRIPTGTNTTINDILTLLGNTHNAIANFANDRTFGLSANCWQQVSGLINSRVCKDTLYISPGLTLKNLSEYYDAQSNIHYFNLHGSNQAAEWYGQKGQDYPVAFAPSAIAQNKILNIVGVEACYGARFINLPKEQSILLSALAAKTVSFVGSSRIAWGPSSPPMNLADVVIHDFLALIQEGWTAGEAFLKARINGYLNSVDKDPLTSLLTMMEFNLFGDPLFFFSPQDDNNAKSVNSTSKGVRLDNPGTDGNQMDDLSEEDLEKSVSPSNTEDSVYSRVTQAVDEAQRKITALINKKVWDKYPEYKNVEPLFKRYSYQGKQYNSLTYEKKLEKFDKYLMVNADDNGDVVIEFDSK